MTHSTGHNMSVLGSQVDVDMDESVPDPVPKHQGHTGTGCYKLHDHEFMRPKHRVTGTKPEVDKTAPPTNIMDLPVDSGAPQQAVQQLKHMSSPAHRSPVRRVDFIPDLCDASFNQIYPIFWNGNPQMSFYELISSSHYIYLLRKSKDMNAPFWPCFKSLTALKMSLDGESGYK